MNMEFAISAWDAHAAGMSSPAQWTQWATRPVLPTGEEAPALSEMPAMLRRRLGPLGRMAAQVAYRVQPPDAIAPIVFASRYGDAQRSLNLLGDFAAGQAVSPTDFALSVHNAIGAMSSIARADTANYSAVAAGAATAGAGVIEAVGMLDDGCDEVVLVCYDAPLPGDWSAFADEPQASWAWAWRLRKPQPQDKPITVSTARAPSMPPGTPPPALPFGLDVLRFALSGDALMERSCDGTTWTWGRND